MGSVAMEDGSEPSRGGPSCSACQQTTRGGVELLTRFVLEELGSFLKILNVLIGLVHASKETCPSISHTSQR